MIFISGTTSIIIRKNASCTNKICGIYFCPKTFIFFFLGGGGGRMPSCSPGPCASESKKLHCTYLQNFRRFGQTQIWLVRYTVKTQLFHFEFLNKTVLQPPLFFLTYYHRHYELVIDTSWDLNLNTEVLLANNYIQIFLYHLHMEQIPEVFQYIHNLSHSERNDNAILFPIGNISYFISR